MLRFRPLPLLTLCFVPALALLIGLGVWQLERLQWKLDLIARVHRSISAPAEPLQQAITGGLSSVEWRHVTLRGRFSNVRELYLFAPSKEGEPGYHVVTPFVLENDGVTFVDRGFVPENRKLPATRKDGLFEGTTEVAGIVRLSQAPGLFTPLPDKQTRTFYARDVGAMSALAGLRITIPVVVELDATAVPGGWPKGGQTRVDFRNDHLQYAITWFGLALVLTAVYLLFHVKQQRLSFG